MGSFFKGFMKLVKGEPVFTSGDQNSGQVAEAQTVPQPAPAKPSRHDAHGRKIIPLVTVAQIKVKLHGDDMEIEAELANHSELQIELDKIKLLGSTRELDSFLRPGQEREYVIYEGKRLNHTSYQYAELHYKDPTGDYFSAIHFVEFQQEPDRTYSVRRMRFLPPIKDI